MSGNGARNGNDWTPLEDVVSKDILKSEIRSWAVRIGVEPTEVHVRTMTRKWGLCSTTGRVTFNADLLQEPARFRREVIVHELLHIKVPNHGRVFRALLKAYLGLDDVHIPEPVERDRRGANT